MGMFDRISGEMPCQKCGRPVTGFQSKDADCVLAELTPQQLFDETGSWATFYTICPHCDVWNEWTFAPSKSMQVIPFEPGAAS